MNASLKQPKLALGLIEAGLTMAGIVAAITPLALWAAWSETVFYTVLSVGCGAFLVFIGLARVRGYLTGEEYAEADALGLKSLRRRMEDWERLQLDDRAVGRRQRSIKGDAAREFSLMLRVAGGLILTAAAMFTALWAILETYYGS